ncbi:WD40-repeat-containing domain protein [Rhizoctonia solani]|nr:WD40-repeat-containing domain protein [Rhizoctonia solani]
MSSHHPPDEKGKRGFRKTMRSSIHWVKDTFSGPSSPYSPSEHTGRLNTPGTGSHHQYFSQPNTPTLISEPAPNQSDLQATVPPPEPLTQDPARDVTVITTLGPENSGSGAWNLLTSSLRALEAGVKLFPPLKAAVGALIGCLNVVQVAASNRKDYEQLAEELQSMADILNQYVGELQVEPRTGSITNIAQCIQDQVADIKKQEEHGTIGRLLDAAHDQEDVIRRYRQIKNLFQQLGCDLSMRTRSDVKKQLEITLLRGMSPVDDAKYNSSYSTTIKRRACTAETREAMHQALQEWTTNPESAKIYWMNGMAGTGKTTIAYSFCEWLESTNRLGASFFCSRISSTCRSLSQIVLTLAYQLARYSPAFRSELCASLNDHPDAGTLNVVQQFEMLLKNPMLSSKEAMSDNVVVVIDALDECDDVYSVRLLLDVLLKFSQSLPLKFFVASRPEHVIRDRMVSQGGSSRTIVHLHDIEESIVEGDIKKYLSEALSLMQPPPSLKQIELLAKRSRNLFIYAATVVRYIYPEDVPVNSTTRLKSMLVTVGAPETNVKNRYKDLDRLYTTVLSAAFNESLDDDEQDHMRCVLYVIVCAKEPLVATTIASLAKLTEDQVWTTLQSLRSVVHVPEDQSLISTLHASFPEYMLDRSRSMKFCCDQSKSNEALLHRCFDVMKSELRFNICNLESSYLTDDQVDDMKARVTRFISPTVSYACRYWGAHLSLSPAVDNTRNMLLDFLHNRLLFWMEVLSLSCCVGDGAPIMSQAQTWLRRIDSNQDEIQKQVSDARNFVTWFAANPCSQSTPHIYVSALPLCAKSSWVYQHYRKNTRGLAIIASIQDEALLAIWRTGSVVNTLTISPDGSRIVSGHKSGTIHIYDAQTGAEVAEPIRAHTQSVESVTFSPTGSHIASGSADHTICIWDSYTGVLTSGPLRGHTGSSTSVAFSPDGSRIISGSFDHTVIIWDTLSGAILFGPLQGHSGWVSSVTFSPDGRLIASGSEDQTIRLWDAYTGEPAAEPFIGHEGWIFSVAFSPDGKHVASGSVDETVRIWDVQSGVNVVPPLEGHKGGVSTIRIWDVQIRGSVTKQRSNHETSVGPIAFSPDCTQFVSHSLNGALQIWNVQSEDVKLGPFDQKTTADFSTVHSVAFSPQGLHVAATGSDLTIWVWDVYRVLSERCSPMLRVRRCDIIVWDIYTGAPVGPSCKGNEAPVLSVAYSPDGLRLVSGSDDTTVRVWNPLTGELLHTFNGHTGPVTSVTFSPTGTYIASGCADGKVWRWDAPSSNTHEISLKAYKERASSKSVSDLPPESSYDQFIILGPVNRVCFSSDSTRILAGAPATVRVFDAQTMVVVSELCPFRHEPTHWVGFYPDSADILSVSAIGNQSEETTQEPKPNIIRGWRPVTHDPSSKHSMKSYWTYRHDGWIISPQGMVIWVSPDLLPLLKVESKSYYNPFILSADGIIDIGYNDMCIGDRWSECYTHKDGS